MKWNRVGTFLATAFMAVALQAQTPASQPKPATKADVQQLQNGIRGIARNEDKLQQRLTLGEQQQTEQAEQLQRQAASIAAKQTEQAKQAAQQAATQTATIARAAELQKAELAHVRRQQLFFFTILLIAVGVLLSCGALIMRRVRKGESMKAPMSEPISIDLKKPIENPTAFKVRERARQTGQTKLRITYVFREGSWSGTAMLREEENLDPVVVLNGDTQQRSFENAKKRALENVKANVHVTAVR